MNNHISKAISIIAICGVLAGCANVKSAVKHNEKHYKGKTTVAEIQSNTTNGNISYYFPKMVDSLINT